MPRIALPPPWLMASSHAPIRAMGSAGVLPLERPDQWAALFTDKDIVTLRHRTEQRMGENTLRARASDRLDLEAGSLASSGSPLPWLACLGTG